MLLAVILTLQSAWILGTTFVQERALQTGKVVLLETRPVDPRDLIRGDYLTLNYKISDVPLALFAPSRTNAPPAGKTVYVTLEPKGQFYEAVAASTEPVVPTDSQIVLRGRVQDWWRGPNASSVHVAYGLEQYFVREGAGNPRGKLTVQVAVPASGQGRIKEVLVDGRPYAQAVKP